jgi:nucleotide-binding universal stress UspA family protein
MLQISRILAPTDFSRHADVSVKYACGLAERFSSELHLLHVLAEVVLPVGPDPSLVATMPPEFYTTSEEQTREALQQLIPSGWPQPASVKVDVRWGDAVEEIVSYASGHHIDLIVIATHGRSGLSHVLLGSVAERIIRESPCPVLTIRDRTQT